MVVTIVLVAAVVQWLFFGLRYAIKRDWEKLFLVSTGVMAVIWLLLAPQTVTPAAHASASPVETGRTGKCFAINPGMSEADARAIFSAKPKVLSEEDTQGPGASALVYADERCVVHLLNGRVRAVRF